MIFIDYRLDWIVRSSYRLDWIGLDWIGLDWIGLDWIGLDWIGLDWIGLDWIGLDWIGLDWQPCVKAIYWFCRKIFISSLPKGVETSNQLNYSHYSVTINRLCLIE